MADTARSVADVKARLPDNTTRLISPQDLRDFVESIANPLREGGFDAIPGHVAIAGTQVDPPEDIYAGSTRTWSRLAIVDPSSTYAAYDAGGTDGYDIAALLSVTHQTIDGTHDQGTYGNLYTLIAAAKSVADTWGATAICAWSEWCADVLGFAAGVEAAAFVTDGAHAGYMHGLQVQTGSSGVGTVVDVERSIWVRRAGPAPVGIAQSYGVRVDAPHATGRTNTTQLYLGAAGTGTDDWNIFSAGASSKNKLEGRVFQGVPDSAPSDSLLGNGQVSAYLDQAGNALKFRVRYSDGTLKTGSVALT